MKKHLILTLSAAIITVGAFAQEATAPKVKPAAVSAVSAAQPATPQKTAAPANTALRANAIAAPATPPAGATVAPRTLKADRATPALKAAPVQPSK